MNQQANTDKLLPDLRSADASHRSAAAEALGGMTPADEGIQSAPKTVALTDSNTNVINATAESYVDLTELSLTEDKSASRETWSGWFFMHRGIRFLLFLGIFVAGMVRAYQGLTAMGNSAAALFSPLYFSVGIGIVGLIYTGSSTSLLLGVMSIVFCFIYWSMPIVGILTSKRQTFVALFLFFAALSAINVAGTVSGMKDFCVFCDR